MVSVATSREIALAADPDLATEAENEQERDAIADQALVQEAPHPEDAPTEEAGHPREATHPEGADHLGRAIALEGADRPGETGKTRKILAANLQSADARVPAEAIARVARAPDHLLSQDHPFVKADPRGSSKAWKSRMICHQVRQPPTVIPRSTTRRKAESESRCLD